MKESGIKQLDEAQRLLQKEHAESGLQYMLMISAEHIFGVALMGNPLHLAATLGAEVNEQECIEQFVNYCAKISEFHAKRKAEAQKGDDSKAPEAETESLEGYTIIKAGKCDHCPNEASDCKKLMLVGGETICVKRK